MRVDASLWQTGEHKQRLPMGLTMVPLDRAINDLSFDLAPCIACTLTHQGGGTAQQLHEDGA